MVVAKLPWYLVKQFDIVVEDYVGPSYVMDPRTDRSMVVLSPMYGDRTVTVQQVDPMALATVLIQEERDALTVLTGQFIVEEIDEQGE